LDGPDGFEILGGRGLYRPAGTVTFDQLVGLVHDAIATARREGARGLLVNTCGLDGFATPDTAQRFFAVKAWAEAAGGVLRLAVVARPEMIDPHQFGVTVAANRGLVSNIFAREAEAIAWLDSM
jgi:hypothetical protein